MNDRGFAEYRTIRFDSIDDFRNPGRAGLVLKGLWLAGYFLMEGVRCFSVFAQQESDIRDIRPPVAYPVNWLFWLLIAVLTGGVCAWWILARRKRPQKRQEGSAVALKPAWVVAREDLARLKEKGYPEKGMLREYYFELSYIVRRYIENRFRVKAPEMTTEEFLESLKSSSVLSAEQKTRLQDFLTGCDMIKFARYRAGTDEMDQSFQIVSRFIDETEGAGSGS